jgi:DNA-binding transcriptional ArsR family regulator
MSHWVPDRACGRQAAIGMSKFLMQFHRPAVYLNGGPVLFCKKFFCLNIYRNIAINMGATKTEIFTARQNKLAQMLRALGHPARIAILEQLLKTNSCINGDLVEELGLAQATISQHLKELKNIGLIKGNVEGTSVCYCIDGKVWKQYRKELEAFFIPFDNNCC